MHMAVLVDGRGSSAVERSDLRPSHPGDCPGMAFGHVARHTGRPEASAAGLLGRMQRTGRRRLAVTDGEGALVGLLCLDGSGPGFCSNEDVASRKRSHLVQMS